MRIIRRRADNLYFVAASGKPFTDFRGICAVAYRFRLVKDTEKKYAQKRPI
jgi:hypothetical protein